MVGTRQPTGPLAQTRSIGPVYDPGVDVCEGYSLQSHSEESKAMELTLTTDEAQTLRGLLADHLPRLEFELARTHGVEIRQVLADRLTLCERLLDQLSSAAGR